MAQSKCPKCENKSFEMVEHTPAKSAFQLMFIQCDKCGTVVGVSEYFNTSQLLHNIRNDLRKIAKGIKVELD